MTVTASGSAPRAAAAVRAASAACVATASRYRVPTYRVRAGGTRLPREPALSRPRLCVNRTRLPRSAGRGCRVIRAVAASGNRVKARSAVTPSGVPRHRTLGCRCAAPRSPFLAQPLLRGDESIISFMCLRLSASRVAKSVSR